MSRLITRTVTATTVKCGEVKMENGHPLIYPLGEFTLSGKIPESKMIKEARKRFGKDKSIVILESNITSGLYGCTLDDFMSVSHLIEK